MNWVSVKERLPDSGVPVVVYGENVTIDWMRYCTLYREERSWGPTRWQSLGWGGPESEMEMMEDEITHWVELTPPEGSENA